MTDNKIDYGNLTGPQKAAIFLLNMGEDDASVVFSNMSEDEIRTIANIMTKIDQVPPESLKAVSNDFIERFQSDTGLFVEGKSFVEKVITSSMDREKAEMLMDSVEFPKKDVPFEWSRDVNVATLAKYIEEEHPQTIAMILSHLPPEISSEVMMSIPEDKKGDIALRVVQLGQVPEEIIRDVEKALRAELGNIGKATKKADGLQLLVEMLNGVDKSTEDTIMTAIEEENNEMATSIRNMMFVFEDLATIDDRAMREILKKVEGNELAYALKTASEKMKQKIFGNLSSRASEMLQEDLDVMGPVRLSEVEEAQQAIVKSAKELEAEGVIILGGKGKEDVLV